MGVGNGNVDSWALLGHTCFVWEHDRLHWVCCVERGVHWQCGVPVQVDTAPLSWRRFYGKYYVHIVLLVSRLHFFQCGLYGVLVYAVFPDGHDRAVQADGRSSIRKRNSGDLCAVNGIFFPGLLSSVQRCSSRRASCDGLPLESLVRSDYSLSIAFEMCEDNPECVGFE